MQLQIGNECDQSFQINFNEAIDMICTIAVHVGCPFDIMIIDAINVYLVYVATAMIFKSLQYLLGHAMLLRQI